MATMETNAATRAVQESALQNQAALRAIAAGDLASAESALLQAVGFDRENLSAWLNLAAVRRQRNDIDGAFSSIQQVLILDARSRGPAHECEPARARGRAAPAAPRTRPRSRTRRPTTLRRGDLRAVKRGRAVTAPIHRNSGITSTRRCRCRRRCTAAERRRVESFIDMTLRVRRRYRQEPTEYYYPGLPAIEFYERSEFPWIEEFEAQTAAIGQELANIVREDAGGFTPYIHYAPHMPLDQWRELNHSPRWSAFHFFEKGEPIADRHRRAPRRCVARIPQAAVAASPKMAARRCSQRPHTAAHGRRELPPRRARALRSPRAADSVSAAKRASGASAKRGCSTTLSSTRHGMTATSLGTF
jgi:hypothetical protein